jgi:hypothetical protein
MIHLITHIFRFNLVRRNSENILIRKSIQSPFKITNHKLERTSVKDDELSGSTILHKEHITINKETVC